MNILYVRENGGTYDDELGEATHSQAIFIFCMTFKTLCLH